MREGRFRCHAGKRLGGTPDGRILTHWGSKAICILVSCLYHSLSCSHYICLHNDHMVVVRKASTIVCTVPRETIKAALARSA